MTLFAWFMVWIDQRLWPEVMPSGHWGQWAKVLFAIGLFDAGFLGALCISLATSWALGEVFGWAHSLNNRVREAPWFYAFYFFSLISAGIVVLIVYVVLLMSDVAIGEAVNFAGLGGGDIRDRGINVQRLIPDDREFDPVTGLAQMSAVPVNVYPAGR